MVPLALDLTGPRIYGVGTLHEIPCSEQAWFNDQQV